MSDVEVKTSSVYQTSFHVFIIIIIIIIIITVIILIIKSSLIKKEAERILKYKDLTIEIHRM